MEMPMEIVNKSLMGANGENDLSVLFPHFEDGEQGSNTVEYPQSPKEPRGNLKDYSNWAWQELKSEVSTQCSKLKSNRVSMITFEQNTSSLIFEMATRLERGEIADKNKAQQDIMDMQRKVQSALEGLKNA